MHDKELPAASQATSFTFDARGRESSGQAGELSGSATQLPDGSSNKFSLNSGSNLSEGNNNTTVIRSRKGQFEGGAGEGAAGESLLKLLRQVKKGQQEEGAGRRSRLEELISSSGYKSWCEHRTIIVNIRNGPSSKQTREQQQVIESSNKSEENYSSSSSSCCSGSEIAGKLFDSLNLNQQEALTTSKTLAAVKTRGRILAGEKQQSRQKQRQPNQQLRLSQEKLTSRQVETDTNKTKITQSEGNRNKQESEQQHLEENNQVALGSHERRGISKINASTSSGKINQTTNSSSSAGELEVNDAEKQRQVEGKEEGNFVERGEDEDDREVGKKSTGFGGSVAYKLSRLPYFSYYGKARNINLLSAASRQRRQKEDRLAHNEDIENSAGSSASSSQRSLNSLTSGIPTLTRRFGASASPSATSGSSKSSVLSEEQQTKGGRRSAGYSNISNIYPTRSRKASLSGETSRQVSLRFKDQEKGNSNHEKRFATGKRQQFGSLANLNHAEDQQNLSSTLTSRRNSFNQSNNLSKQNRSLSGSLSTNLLTNAEGNTSSKTKPTSSMRRQYSSYLGGGTYNKSAATANGKFGSQVGGYRDRPGSATGYALARQHKSPSTSSLLYTGNSTGVSPFTSRNDPSLVDPDCPVHGYSPVNVLSKSAQHLAPPELLYENDYPPADGYYPDAGTRVRTGGGSRGNLYSPGSPPPQQLVANSSRRAGRPQQAGTGAYYDNASRFSLYHSPSSDLRSSLAPANEQLRRILGYQPIVLPRPVHLHPQWAYSRPFIHLQGPRSPSPSGPLDPMTGEPLIRPIFEPFNQLQDSQAVRAVDFHPSGEVYAVGSNSRALRICAYPADYELRHFSIPLAQQQQQQQQSQVNPAPAPRVLFKFLQLHRGSIYCVRFNSTGQLLATGSNDQTVHIVRYNSTTHSPDGDEYRLTMHDGTIRDLTFIDDSTNGSALLLSAGGGDNKIYVTDCDTITPFQSMSGHTQTVMALHHWAGASFVSASLDRSIRFWDLRTRHCTSIVSAPASSGSKGAGPGAPVCSVKVDPSGRLLASGHSDATCMLYDIRAARIIQAHKPHDDEIRTLGFSPKSYYLLTGGYDGRILLTDLQGDLTQPLPTSCVAECTDKVVQSKWHPSDFTFVTTSADKTATLWAMPTE